MRTIVLLAVSMMMACSSFGQSVFDLGTPRIGDTILYMTDYAPEAIDLHDGHQHLHWDFRGLQAPVAVPYVFKAAEKGHYAELFPQADLMLWSIDGTERYFRQRESYAEELGFAGPDPFLNDAFAVIRYSTSAPTFRLSIRPHRVYDDVIRYAHQYTASRLPSAWLRELPMGIDSLRVQVVHRTDKRAVGRGQLLLPDAFDDVLCMRHDVRIETSCEALYRGRWVPVNLQSRPRLREAFGLKTQRSYRFYKEGVTAPTAIVHSNMADVVESVEFAPAEGNPVIVRSSNERKEIFAYPNPTFGDVRFNLINYASGRYTIEIYNVIGKKLRSKAYQLDRSGIIKESFTDLKKGTYLYSVFDAAGRKLTTKRLVIITP